MFLLGSHWRAEYLSGPGDGIVWSPWEALMTHRCTPATAYRTCLFHVLLPWDARRRKSTNTTSPDRATLPEKQTCQSRNDSEAPSCASSRGQCCANEVRKLPAMIDSHSRDHRDHQCAPAYCHDVLCARVQQPPPIPKAPMCDCQRDKCSPNGQRAVFSSQAFAQSQHGVDGMRINFSMLARTNRLLCRETMKVSSRR